MAVAAEAAKPTILVAEKLGKGGVDMLKEVGLGDCWVHAGLAGLARRAPCLEPSTQLGFSWAPPPPPPAARQVGTVDCTYDMSKEELLAKISLCDAIVIRSATKASPGAIIFRP